MNESRIYNQLNGFISNNSLPPVEKWNPPVMGEIDIRIASDGTWYHEGDPILRQPLVRLFASVLWREGDNYFLVTPVEKVRIKVDDAPFLVVDVSYLNNADGPVIQFTTLTGELFSLDAQHPLRIVHGEDAEPRPYVRVRRNLEALVHRNVFYSLVNHALESLSGGDELMVRSAGETFSLGRIED